MRCRICKQKGHNRAKCLLNSEITSIRPGKRRNRCRPIFMKDMRKLRRVKLFDRPKNHESPKKVKGPGRRKNSIVFLERAKRAVFNYLNKIEADVYADKVSSFEKAWFEASGENQLNFNFADMREGVMNAKYGIKTMQDYDFAYNDGLQIIINRNYYFTQTDIEQILFHECLHHNVTRNRPGMRALNEDIDHLAMALLGDRDEISNMKLGWFDCVFGPECPNPKHWID